eukprot:scaffold104802_cov31-Tisochrysis_lutea.AAC.5
MCGVLPASPAATDTNTLDRASGRSSSDDSFCARSAMRRRASNAAARDLTLDSLVASTTSPSRGARVALSCSADRRETIACQHKRRRRLEAVWQAGRASARAAETSSRWVERNDGWCSASAASAL